MRVQVHSYFSSGEHTAASGRNLRYSSSVFRNEQIAYAMLADGVQEEDHAVMVLRLSNGGVKCSSSHLSSILSSVCKGNDTWVLLRKVLSQPWSSVADAYSFRRNSLGDRHDIVLIPTSGTTIDIFSNEKRAINARDPMQEASSSSLPPPFHSNTLEEELSMIRQVAEGKRSMKVNSRSPCLVASDLLRIERREIRSKLCDIYLDDLDLFLMRSGEPWTAEKFLTSFLEPSGAATEDLCNVWSHKQNSSLQSCKKSATLSKTDRVRFRMSTLILCDSLLPEINAKADERAMEVLCASTSAEDLLHDVSRNSKSTGLVILVLNMLVALVKEEVNFLWTVERRENCWYVTDVKMPVL